MPVPNVRNVKIKNIPRFAFHEKQPHNLHVPPAIIIFRRYRASQKESCQHNTVSTQLLFYLSLFKIRDNAYDFNQLIQTKHDWKTLHRVWTMKLTLKRTHSPAVKSYKQWSLLTKCHRKFVYLRQRVYSSLKAILSLHVWWIYIFLLHV